MAANVTASPGAPMTSATLASRAFTLAALMLPAMGLTLAVSVRAFFSGKRRGAFADLSERPCDEPEGQQKLIKHAKFIPDAVNL